LQNYLQPSTFRCKPPLNLSISPMSATDTYTRIDKQTLQQGYQLMCLTQALDQLYQEHFAQLRQYPFSTSRGHEAIQIATALQLKPYDYVAPYYRDEALLLALGVPVAELVGQLLGKKTVASSGKNPYLLNPVQPDNAPRIIFSGSGTGTHLITATGLAQGLDYQFRRSSSLQSGDTPVVVCSVGDGALANGEASEAFQMAVLKKLPILYLVQDNDWMASAPAEEIRAVDAYEFAGGFKGMKRSRVNGADFVQAYDAMLSAFEYVRSQNMPALLHVKCPLLTNHSSYLPKEAYRTQENLDLHRRDEPLTRLRKYLVIEGETEEGIARLELNALQEAKTAYQSALSTPDMNPEEVSKIALHPEFNPSPEVESGNRTPSLAPVISFAEAATRSLDSLLAQFPEAVFMGQDIGKLGGLYQEAAQLAKNYGANRVFNMPQVPAYLTGCTAGWVLAGCKPIVEIQSADYIWSGLNQLVNSVAKSDYLTDGKFPVQALFRIATGAIPGEGPFQSASIESVLLSIKGLKVVYPSNAADLKGLMKAAFADPNPVVVLEHKALYHHELAKSPEPDNQYSLPLGKAAIAQAASAEKQDEGYTCAVITYGMGVHRAKQAGEKLGGVAEVLDLRSLYPLDFEAVVACVKRHGKVLVLTEESETNSFAEALAGRITQACFKFLDAPVHVLGSADVPAIPMNEKLARTILPDVAKVAAMMEKLLNY
jgi:2-oxoisovalerate dehydrogenase E1 component